jgi:hypothetical protein
MLTVQQIIDEARGLIMETDPNNSHVTDATFLLWINACTLSLCSYIQSLPKSSITSVVTAAKPVLPTNLLRVDYVSYLYSGQHHPIKTIDFVNFLRENAQWENQPAGVPTYFVRMDDTTWMMYPPPDTAHTGLPITLIGAVVPDNVASPSEYPPVNQVLHPCYPYYLAWKAWAAIGNPASSAQSYAVFEKIRTENMKSATSTQGSRQFLRMEI